MSKGTELINEIRNARVQDGELMLWWIGQMGVILKSADHVISIDAYLSDQQNRLVPSLLLPEELSGVDFVFGSHDHADHIDRTAWKVIAANHPETTFVVPKLLISELSESLNIPAKRFVGISDLKTAVLGQSLRVCGIAAAHEFLDRDEKSGEYPYMGYSLEIGGFRIYHAGDTCIYEGLAEKLRRAGRYDLMILPINGRDAARYKRGCIGNMTYQEAADLSGSLQPGLVIPGHYDMFSGNTENPELFSAYLEAKYPDQRFQIAAYSHPIVLRKCSSRLPE